MRSQHVLASIATISLSMSYVAADFNYGILTCSEAQGGWIDAGFILPKQHDTCLNAFKADNPGNNIPPNSTIPTGLVCAHNVTVDLKTLKWHSKSNQAGTPMSGSCWKLGKSGHGVNSTCTPYLAQCAWNDRVACSSHICDHSSSRVAECDQAYIHIP